MLRNAGDVRHHDSTTSQVSFQDLNEYKDDVTIEHLCINTGHLATVISAISTFSDGLQLMDKRYNALKDCK